MRRVLLLTALVAALWGLRPDAHWPAAAQDGQAQVVVERPLPGTTVSTQVHISGWAVDPAGPATGIDAVHVYMDGEPGQPRARFLGAASYGQPRPDVARALGDPRFTNSGFALLVDLPPGSHSLYVYAHSADAGPNEGWTRATVGTFETSSIIPAATMVQPGPAPAGDSGRYTTGPATWQGGNTCLRYTGAGTCEASIPLSIVTGATCIQWNARGQCMAYLPTEGALAGVSAAAPTPPPRRYTGPLTVPTVTAGGVPRPPGVGAPRAVAPAAGSEEGAEELAPADGASIGPPSAALPAAEPPPPAEEGEAEAASPPLTVRAAAPPPAASAAVRSAAPPSAGVPSASAAAPRPVARPAPSTDETASQSSAAVEDLAIPAEAPPPVPDNPRVVATATALAVTGGGSMGIAPLRSGCALYLGCGGESPPTSVPRPAMPPPPAAPQPSAPQAPFVGGSAGQVAPAPVPAAPSGAAIPAPGVTAPAPGVAAGSAPVPAPGVAAPGAGPIPATGPSPTPTPCPPFAPCPPAAR